MGLLQNIKYSHILQQPHYNFNMRLIYLIYSHKTYGRQLFHMRKLSSKNTSIFPLSFNHDK